MFPSFIPLSVFLLSHAVTSQDQSQLVLSPQVPSVRSACPPNLPTSCHLPSNAGSINSCCTNVPGGQLLLTQFWDFHPSTGPVTSWTMHGLWPDNCDGTYEASCDSTRAYTNITQILQNGGGQEALDFMKTFWKDQRGNDEQFWQHEWGKHGTCISTLEPSCYGQAYKPQTEVVEFFNRTVDLFKSLPTYDWLAAAGITPSTSVTYTLAQLQAVAKAHFGHDAVWNCRGHALNEVWWHYNTVGTIANGKFIATNPIGPLSSCPHSGIQYLPKSGKGGGHSPHPPNNPPSHPSPTRKHFVHVVHSSGERMGCLIGSGAWYTRGTCASFTMSTSQDRILEIRSRKGPCAFQPNGNFRCGSGIKSQDFSYNGTFILHGGQQRFHASAIPDGRSQIPIHKSEGKELVQLQVGPAH